MNKIVLLSILIAGNAHHIYCAEKSQAVESRGSAHFSRAFGWTEGAEEQTSFPVPKHFNNLLRPEDAANAKKLLETWRDGAKTEEEKKELQLLLDEGPRSYLGDTTTQQFAFALEGLLKFPSHCSDEEAVRIVNETVDKEFLRLYKKHEELVKSRLKTKLLCLLITFHQDAGC